MRTRYVLVLSYHDRSGIRQAFGPYDTEAAAEQAKKDIAAMPAIEGGAWDIVPCTNFGTSTPPAPLVVPAPLNSPQCPPTPWWQGPVICSVTEPTTDPMPGPEERQRLLFEAVR